MVRILNGNQRSRHLSGQGNGRAKTDPPLVIDANAVLAVAITVEGFQPVAAKCSEVSQAACGFKAIKSYLCLSCKTRELSDVIASREAFRLLVSEADNHRWLYTRYYALRKE
jgi:hypothetical protein